MHPALSSVYSAIPGTAQQPTVGHYPKNGDIHCIFPPWDQGYESNGSPNCQASLWNSLEYLFKTQIPSSFSNKFRFLQPRVRPKSLDLLWGDTGVLVIRDGRTNPHSSFPCFGLDPETSEERKRSIVGAGEWWLSCSCPPGVIMRKVNRQEDDLSLKWMEPGAWWWN